MGTTTNGLSISDLLNNLSQGIAGFGSLGAQIQNTGAALSLNAAQPAPVIVSGTGANAGLTNAGNLSGVGLANIFPLLVVGVVAYAVLKK